MIEFRAVTPTGRVPDRDGDGFIVYADMHAIGESVWVYPGARLRIFTGLQMTLPKHSYIRFIPYGRKAIRESMGIVIDTFHNERVADDLKLIFINHGDTKIAITHGDPIALGLPTPTWVAE